MNSCSPARARGVAIALHVIANYGAGAVIRAARRVLVRVEGRVVRVGDIGSVCAVIENGILLAPPRPKSKLLSHVGSAGFLGIPWRLLLRTRVAQLSNPRRAVPRRRSLLDVPARTARRRRYVTGVIPSCPVPDWSTSKAVSAIRLRRGALVSHTEFLPRIPWIATRSTRNADGILDPFRVGGNWSRQHTAKRRHQRK